GSMTKYIADVEAQLPSLAKEGWTRHQLMGPVPLNGTDGHERSECFGLSASHSLRSCPSARTKDASRHFIDRASTPPFPRRGVLLDPKSCQKNKKSRISWLVAALTCVLTVAASGAG